MLYSEKEVDKTPGRQWEPQHCHKPATLPLYHVLPHITQLGLSSDQAVLPYG